MDYKQRMTIMDNGITQKEFRQGMSRVHSRIDEIKESSIRQEESSKRIEKFAEDMHKVM